MVKEKQDSSQSRSASLYVVPRLWLIGMAVLVIGPWLVVSSDEVPWTDSDPEPAAADSPAALSATPLEGRPGSWGRLIATPIVISPPAEYVPRTWEPVRPPTWYLPGMAPAALDDWFRSIGVTGSDAARLLPTARVDSRIGGLSLSPDPSAVLGLSPQTRAALYPVLGRFPHNAAQQGAYRYFGTSVDDRLGKTSISASTRQLVDPLIYARDGFLFFADLDAIRERIEDPDQLQMLVKALLRQSTLQVRVHLEDPGQVATAAAYWGVGGRRTHNRPRRVKVAAPRAKCQEKGPQQPGQGPPGK
jgi:hypothetical protein